MPNVWPLTLPPLSQAEGMSGKLGERMLEQQNDEGPPTRRFKTDAAYDSFSFTMLMTTSQVNDLETFYVTTLKGGASSFDDTHPRLNVTKTFFMKAPTWTHKSGPLWTASIELEVKP